MDSWVWPVLLFALGIGLAFLELFFPSAGVLTFLCAGSLVAAIILGLQESHGGPYLGVGLFVLTVVGGPVTVVLALKYWPHTAIGRRVLLGVPESGDEILPTNPQKEYIKSLVGQVVQTKCKMLPAGAVIIDGRVVDAISEGMPIDEGKMVRVVEVRANRVVVRPLSDEETTDDAEDPLRRAIDSIADDPFDEDTPN